MKLLYTVLTGIGLVYGLYLLIGAIIYSIIYIRKGWKMIDTQIKYLLVISLLGIIFFFYV